MAEASKEIPCPGCKGTGDDDDYLGDGCGICGGTGRFVDWQKRMGLASNPEERQEPARDPLKDAIQKMEELRGRLRDRDLKDSRLYAAMEKLLVRINGFDHGDTSTTWADVTCAAARLEALMGENRDAESESHAPAAPPEATGE